MISVENVSFSYMDKKDVLADISFSLTQGERMGVIGPNGAGKTTLFHLLCGLLVPGGGRIVIKGKEVVPKEFNSDIGYVFQNPDDQLFSTTVHDDVAFGPLNLGLGKDEVAKRVETALGITGSTDLKNRPPHHLSGGEKRMVAIATVIAMEPEIIIYDEPSSNLDMRARRNLISFINSSPGTAIVSSHDMEFILETCSRVIFLDGSRIIADDKASDVMNNAKLMKDHGLERPHSLLHGREHSHK